MVEIWQNEVLFKTHKQWATSISSCCLHLIYIGNMFLVFFTFEVFWENVNLLSNEVYWTGLWCYIDKYSRNSNSFHSGLTVNASFS